MDIRRASSICEVSSIRSYMRNCARAGPTSAKMASISPWNSWTFLGISNRKERALKQSPAGAKTLKTKSVSLPWNSKLYATQQYTPYHRRTLGRNPPQELDTVYHLEPHRFGLRNVLVVRLCSIMRVEEPSQVLRALGDTIELLARALVEANNGLLPDLLYGRG